MASAVGLADGDAVAELDGVAVPPPPPEQPANASIAAAITPSAETFRIRFTLQNRQHAYHFHCRGSHWHGEITARGKFAG
ncbi:hypothetical protein ARTHRO8AJ_60012 [Arthrobacter sp. 8AJ]|nr:hypothetical protein ARTHRO8AJ_60012 [Arthrobacter sp. 8AJ]